MNVFPKISENDSENYENIEGYLKLSTGVEIQLLTDNLLKGFEKSCTIIEHFNHIDYIVFHMPFSMVNLSYICANKFIADKYVEFVVACIKYTLKTGKHIDVLCHVGVSFKEFLGMNGIAFLKHLTRLVDGTNVGFLLENSIICLNQDDGEDDVITSIFRIFTHDKVKFCLDLCHWQSSEFVLKEEIEINTILLNNLKNVHFSMTLNNEGYKNKSITHGRCHTNLGTCVTDLDYLRQKGVDLKTVNLITEINESDYQLRPDMTKELEYLRSIKLR